MGAAAAGDRLRRGDHARLPLSFRDWCGDTGVDRELAERCLAHKVGSDAENAYARSSLIERRRPIMEAWGAFVDGARDNVVPFEKRVA